MRNNFLLLCFLLISSQLIAGTRFYRASYRDNPSTTIVLGWSDNGISTNAKVYYDEVDHGTNYTLYASNHGVDRTQSVYSMNQYFSRLTGLKPNTTYYFVVHDDQSTSARMYFKTITDNPAVGICFIAGGDSRTGTTSEAGYLQCRPDRQTCDSLVAKIRPDFLTFNGDFVYTGNTANWTDWFTDWQFTLGNDGHIVPIIPVMGNHESSSINEVYNMFDVPSSTDYFALQMGGSLLRVYSLNDEISTACDPTELTWLTNDLKLYTGTAVEPYWKFAQYHQPFVPHAKYTANTNTSGCWGPLFQQYNVKLACDAHAHVLKVTWPVIPSSATGSDHGFIRDDLKGTVYIGEGSWGAPQRTLYTYYNANQAYNWTRNQIKSAGFQLIYVTTQKIEVRTILATGAKSVGQVQVNDSVGTLPANLPLWNPLNGSVVTLNYSGSLTEVATVNNFQNNLKAFPVPTRNQINFEFPETTESGELRIYDSFGKEIKTNLIPAGSNSGWIDTTNFPTGSYTVFLVSKNSIKSCKIVHQ